MEIFEGFSQILKEQSVEKSTWVCLLTQLQYFKSMKMEGYLRLKFLVYKVIVNADTWFFYFKTEYSIIAKNTKVCKPVSACSYGAQLETFEEKIEVEKISRHCPIETCIL